MQATVSHLDVLEECLVTDDVDCGLVVQQDPGGRELPIHLGKLEGLVGWEFFGALHEELYPRVFTGLLLAISRDMPSPPHSGST
jgi:hypothetical protein